MVEQTVKAHVISEEGVILNTVTVPSLDFLPNLVDASQGGGIGDRWDGEQFIPVVRMEERVNEARSECERRILAVINRNAQINLTSHRAAGRLSLDQQAIHDSGLDWIRACQQAAVVLATDTGADISDDANWPVPTQAMIDLAASF